MNIVTNDILGLDEVFNLLSKPRNLSAAEFGHLCHFTNTNLHSIIVTDNVREAAVATEIATSNADFGRMIKRKSIGVGKRRINKKNETLSEADFFETGIDKLLWTTIKNGKKIMTVMLIQDLGEGFFSE